MTISVTATALCVFDGPLVPDGFVTISTKVNGQCHAEPAGPIRPGRIVIGRVANGQQLTFTYNADTNHFEMTSALVEYLSQDPCESPGGVPATMNPHDRMFEIEEAIESRWTPWSKPEEPMFIIRQHNAVSTRQGFNEALRLALTLRELGWACAILNMDGEVLAE